MPIVRTVSCALCADVFYLVNARGKHPKRKLCASCSESRRRPCAACGDDFLPRTVGGVGSSYCVPCQRDQVRRGKQGLTVQDLLPARECLRCGKEFAPPTRRSMCCSRACGLAANERFRSNGAVDRSELVPCGECGAPCRAAFGRCRGCRDARRSASHRGALKVRRERVYQGGDRGISWESVGERDDWVCHLCGGSVNRLAGTAYEPWGATVDHLVPIVDGGAHVWSNVALAHRRCNVSRGARPLEVSDGGE